MPEDYLADEELVDEGLAPLPEEGVADMAAGEEVPAAESVITLTLDDIPELADFQIGDEVTLQIAEISDDGKYSMSLVPVPAEAVEEPMAEEEVGLEGEAPMGAPAAPAGGREAVLGALTG
jgi:hypothetical protein